jgi:hypothetical protein
MLNSVSYSVIFFWGPWYISLISCDTDDVCLDYSLSSKDWIISTCHSFKTDNLLHKFILNFILLIIKSVDKNTYIQLIFSDEIIQSFLPSFFPILFSMVLGNELRASHLLGRHFSTWATLPALFSLVIFEEGSHFMARQACSTILYLCV